MNGGVAIDRTRFPPEKRKKRKISKYILQGGFFSSNWKIDLQAKDNSRAWNGQPDYDLDIRGICLLISPLLQFFLDNNTIRFIFPSK